MTKQMVLYTRYPFKYDNNYAEYYNIKNLDFNKYKSQVSIFISERK
jgi:hypothetical protein